MENLKFRVHSPEHSKAIQERLFELGYKWCSGDIKAICTELPFLFADNDGTIGHGSILDYFNAQLNHKETTLDKTYEMTALKKIRLNSDYEAIIKDGFVEVGCQKIEFERIEELYKLIKQ